MSIFISSVLTFLLIVPSVAFSLSQEEEGCPQQLSIGVVLDTALKNHPETKVAYWDAQRAYNEHQLSFAECYPSLSLEAYLKQSRDYKFVKGPETTFLESEANLVLSYLLLDFGRTQAEIQATKAILRSMNWQANWVVQKVLGDVLVQAYDYLAEQELLEAWLSSVEDAKVVVKAAEELNRVGLRSVCDIDAGRAAVAEALVEAAEKKAARDLAKTKLALSMGIDVQTEVRLEHLPDPSEDVDRTQELDTFIDLAIRTRADLEAKRAIVESKQAYYKKESRRDLPEVTIDARAGFRHYSRDRDRAKGCNYACSLNFSVPLFTGYESSYGRKVANDQLQMAQAETEEMEWKISLEVIEAYRNLGGAQEVWNYSREALYYSEKAYEGILHKYKAGTQTIFDLVKAQELLSKARIRSSQAKMRWYRSRAQLAYSTGVLTHFLEAPCASLP